LGETLVCLAFWGTPDQLYAGRGFYNDEKESTMNMEETHKKIAKAILWFFATVALGIWFSRLFTYYGWGMG